MATVVALDTSPVNVLRSMRGVVTDARLAYPDVLHLEIRDGRGELWRLATQDADWTPSDPAGLIGRQVQDAEIEDETGVLRCRLSGDVTFEVRPAAAEADDDPPNWELISPEGIALEFGPGVRWQVSGADAPPRRR